MNTDAHVARASDPTTPAPQLRRLARSRARRVRRAAATNPSLPRRELRELFRYFPEEVLSNPASALFDLESRGALGWLRWEDCVTWARNPRSSALVLEKMARMHDHWRIRAVVAENRFAPRSVLASLAHDRSGTVRAMLANNPSAPPEAMVVLANDTNEEIRCIAARHKNTPREALERLEQEVAVEVVACVAKNPSLDVETLDRLASHRYGAVRYWVAEHPATLDATLALLCDDADRDVRETAARYLMEREARRDGERRGTLTPR